jgi:hypothetical protein
MRCFDRCTLLLNGEERAVRNAKISKKLNMQSGDAAEYEAEARTYFDSLRQPFEQTLKSTRHNYAKWVERVIVLIGSIGLVALLFTSSRVVAFVFHQNTFTLSGKPHELTEMASFVFLISALGTMMVGLVLHTLVQNVQIRQAVNPLSQRVMVFALSYAILRELESFERSNLAHHRKTALELWKKFLTYLRWTLQDISAGTAYFHDLPPKDYLVAPCAQQFAEALNWSENRKPEYNVVAALNSLHSKLSPRLQNGQDMPVLKMIFRGMGNFFYSTVVQQRDRQHSWGYGELLRSAEIINGLSVTEPQGSQRASFFSFTVFTHPNFAISFFAWWLVFQTLFVVLIGLSFRFFPTLTMNSQAMVGLIAAPIAAAISMVGIARKSSS